MFRTLALAAGLALLPCLAPVSSSASTLDFSGFGLNQNFGTQLVLPEATITATVGEVLRPTLVNGFCFVLSGGCVGSGTVAFTVPVQNLTFDVFGTAAGESTDVDVFGSAGLLGSLHVTTNGIVDLTSFGTITSLGITMNGVSGTAVRDFSFTQVAEPSSLALLALGAGLAVVRTRRR